MGLLGLSLCAPGLAAAQQTRAEAEKDPVFKAMLEELDRSMSQLQLKGFEKPFFIQYRIEDVDDYSTRAEFGASEGSDRVHQRVARVTVRVGDYKTDSSGGRGDGSLVLTGLDDDPIAIRSALWDATDRAYKSALVAYAQKQAALKEVQTPPQADDFSHEKPVVSLGAPARLQLDEASWANRVAQASGIYRTDAAAKTAVQDIEYSTAEFHARTSTTWLVTSEGTMVRKAQAIFRESVAVGAQAPDGMRLNRSYASTAGSLKGLDSPQTIAQHAAALIASIEDLRKAPLVQEEYHGPVLFSSDAADDMVHSLLGTAVTATRPPLGAEARTMGPFASSYQTRVLPEFMDVVDDPGLKSYAGIALVGAYDVDDEGVPAQAVKLVADGRLENYLVGREPVKDFPQSNGHGRAGVAGPARPWMSVMKVWATNGLSDDELNHKLLELAKDNGLQNVYYVETSLGPRTPRLLYRVGLDGKRELVRGAELDDIDERALRSGIVAAGKDLMVTNYFGDVPTTVLAPALLLDDVTVRRANQKNEKLPFYPPPAGAGGTE